jgi:hypothetical protein
VSFLRFKLTARAALYGWVAAWLLALPFQVLEAVRNVGIDARLHALYFTKLLAISAALWTILTFGFACYCCIVFLFPAVSIVTWAKLAEHRWIWIASNIAFGILLIAMRAHVWTAVEHDGVGFANFWMWTMFTSIFFGVAAEVYWREVKTALAS